MAKRVPTIGRTVYTTLNQKIAPSGCSDALGSNPTNEMIKPLNRPNDRLIWA